MTVKVLFVCMGNICRSPAAEAVFRNLVKEKGLEGKILVDSAGTLNYHAGQFSDQRMIAAASERSYEMIHLARQVRPTDFSEFDYIVAMDNANLEDLKQFTPRGTYKANVSLLLDHCKDQGTCEVPDPYYGGPKGFTHVLDLVEAGSSALLDKIVAEHNLA